MSQRMKVLIGYDGSSCSDAIIADPPPPCNREALPP